MNHQINIDEAIAIAKEYHHVEKLNLNTESKLK